MSVVDSIKNVVTNGKYIILFIVTLVIFIAVTYYVLRTSKVKTNALADEDHQASATSEAELIFFYADWCPHCKKARPIWDQIKEKYNDKIANGYTLSFKEINATEESPDMKDTLNEYEVEGYPTIKLVKDNQVIDYDAKVERETLEKFINTVL